MSAWASGSLAEKLKRQKLAAANGTGPVAPPAAPTSSTAAGGGSGGKAKSAEAPPPAPFSPPPAVKEKPVASPASDKPQQQEPAALVHLGPIALPADVAKLVSADCDFVGVVQAPPAASEESRQPPSPKGPETAPRPTAFAAQPECDETPQTTDTSHLYPVHHPHHHRQQLYQHQHQQHQYQYQPQQRYMQQGMPGQSYHSAYSSVPYQMSPNAMPYRPRMYNGYPGMNMGMGIYGGINEYGGFSLQARHAYYPPPQNPMGPYTPPHQH
ncbi:uncharacterized protein Tco025E_06442 [Trypanosoma conorhini]|uniref:Uncharacterized protein n=1 Tax=Trypanosoma conorhini TaxID=83891 RepID=A0A3R7RTS7_9TRYP|nr:uncharacterized protein Tco025E_06442 [Trypanosoma conorhini]RNF12811.1 hypothetical protein Tco025E_06442 [Trypanosoma conorhini]